jgi:hypothetical protein
VACICQAVIAKTTDYEFGKDHVEQLIARYSDLIPNYEESVATKIREQYCDLKFVAAKKFKTGSIQTFSDLVNCAQKDNQFQEISILLDICGTFRASSADCECGFSLMNLIKSKSRNRMEVDHLDNLMQVSHTFHLDKIS